LRWAPHRTALAPPTRCKYALGMQVVLAAVLMPLVFKLL
jgi:hypothetical protein